MNKMDPAQLCARLTEATTQLLSCGEDWEMVTAALREIHALFAEGAGIRGDISQPRFDQERWLKSGLAVSPHLAAKCLLETYRTTQFTRGIFLGIEKAIERFPNERIRILYAGCGPYGTLLVPLLTRFEPDQIQVTLLDVHPQSIRSVNRLVRALDLEKYIVDVVEADASQYRCVQPTHMVIVEAMQGALAREPQVAITRNLAPQLVENGILIPEQITVDACLTCRGREDFATLVRRDGFGFPIDHRAAIQQRLRLGRLLTLNRDTAVELQESGSLIPPTSIEIPPGAEKYDQFMLVTQVDVFGLYKLSDYESEVSHPVILHPLNGIPGGSQLEFIYSFGQDPGFNYEVIPQNEAVGLPYAG